MSLSLKERKRRASRIGQELARLYPDPKPPLDHRDAFTLLVAVALSAQTTDARVNLVTPALFARAPDPQTMAALSVQQILSFIKTCGLAPTKAKNLKKLSQMLLDLHGGEVPRTFEELEALPGVGHKTASVVMSQMFHIPAFPVDTHVHRLAKRWKLTSGRNVEQTEADLKKLFPENSWNQVSLQIIFYGREYCGARSCDGKTCPLCRELNVKAPDKPESRD
jgi:endonuclease-3